MPTYFKQWHNYPCKDTRIIAYATSAGFDVSYVLPRRPNSISPRRLSSSRIGERIVPQSYQSVTALMLWSKFQPASVLPLRPLENHSWTCCRDRVSTHAAAYCSSSSLLPLLAHQNLLGSCLAVTLNAKAPPRISLDTPNVAFHNTHWRATLPPT